MRIEHEIKLDFNDVLLKPKRSTLNSRREVDLIRKFTFRNCNKKFSGIPIIASNMDGIGTFSMAKELQKYKIMTVIKKSYNIHDWEEAINNGLDFKFISICTGISTLWDSNAIDYQNFKLILKKFPKIECICIDVANGYHEQFVDFVKKIRNEYPDKILIVGNVITGEMVEELIINGADVIKVGIGSGAVCTTRIQAGVGVPQLSGIIECADAANGVGGHIIADGGCVYPGDVAKAFGAGAHFVMLGSMLSGTDQGNGEIIRSKYKTNEIINDQHKIEEKEFVKFYGMSSETANEKYFGTLKDYRSSEGRTVLVPYRGDVNLIVQDILGGVRSACTYIGAKRIKDMPKCTTFVRCSQTHNAIYEKLTIGK